MAHIGNSLKKRKKKFTADIVLVKTPSVLINKLGTDMNSLILKLAMINLFSLNFSLYHFGLRATPVDDGLLYS